MSQDRFDWLEFNDPPPSVEPRPAEKDERQFLQEATRAFGEGEFEPALRAYSSALKCDKALLEAWAGQVRCLVRMREFREAQTWAAKACQLFPDQAILESARGGALAASGLVSEALVASDAALEIAERTGLQEPHIWLERAACLLAQGNRDTARFCLQKVSELRPDDPDWDQKIAVELCEAGEFTSAMSHLHRLVEKRPHRAYAWLLMARASRLLGLRSQAVKSLEQAERLRPNHPSIVEERRLLRRPCWIATLVFVHDAHPSVVALRRWRDERWLSCGAGRLAAAFYDGTAPLVCHCLARLPILRRALRVGLEALALAVRPRRGASPPSSDARSIFR